MKQRVSIAIVILLVPGCAGPAQPDASNTKAQHEAGPGPDAGPTQPSEGSHRKYEYECRRGTANVRGLCIGAIRSSRDSYQEPTVTINPADPKIAAIAVNAGTAASLVRIDLFVTLDGGTSWRHLNTPVPEVPAAGRSAAALAMGDPTIGFDQMGRLHLVGLSSSDPALREFHVYHTYTDDLGLTWYPARVLGDDTYQDRPWIAVGPDAQVAVTWSGNTNRLAFSDDRGENWRYVARATMPQGCGIYRPPVVNSTGVYFACDLGMGREVGVYRFDPATGISKLHGTSFSTPHVWGQKLLSTPVGRLVIVASSQATDLLGVVDHHVLLVAGDHQGTNWSEPTDLIGQLPTPIRDWEYPRILWAAADAWGAVHLLLREGGPSNLWSVARSSEAGATAHVVVDGGSGRVLHQRILAADPLNGGQGPRASFGYPHPDDFHGAAFGPDAGLLAWTWQRGIEFAWVQARQEGVG